MVLQLTIGSVVVGAVVAVGAVVVVGAVVIGQMLFKHRYQALVIYTYISTSLLCNMMNRRW